MQNKACWRFGCKMMHNSPEICQCVFTEHDKNRPVFTNVYNVHLQCQTSIDMVTIMTNSSYCESCLLSGNPPTQTDFFTKSVCNEANTFPFLRRFPPSLLAIFRLDWKKSKISRFHSMSFHLHQMYFTYYCRAQPHPFFPSCFDIYQMLNVVRNASENVSSYSALLQLDRFGALIFTTKQRHLVLTNRIALQENETNAKTTATASCHLFYITSQ